jgi:pimeloyl-ACP methyl ester carboxylesterase
LDIEALGTALNHFMDPVGIEQAIVVGNSMGGAITAELIAEAPQKVSRRAWSLWLGGRTTRRWARDSCRWPATGSGTPRPLLPVAVPDYLRFGMVRAVRLSIAMTKFPAYQRIMSMPVRSWS